ncbi:SRPBCC family protein [Lacinutrix salivirga]
MKYLKYLLLLLLIVIIGLAIYIAVQPNNFEVKRSRTINAPAAVVYNNVIDFKNWESWSSWVEKDPTTVITLPEKTKGVGGAYSWVDKHGNGTMKTTATNPNKTITQQLQFGDFHPSTIEWTFEPTDDGKTTVTWQMLGENTPFLFKASALASGGFDAMIGPDFERGLEKLDSIVVESTKKYSVKVNGITQHGGGFYLYNTTSCKMEDFKSKMQEMMPQIEQYVAKHNIIPSGGPFVIYHKWDEVNNAVMFSCAIPTADRVITTESAILTGQLQPFKAVKTTLIGNYENLKEAWTAGMQFIADNNLEQSDSGMALEAYLTDPTTTPNPADWVTEIFMEVK